MHISYSCGEQLCAAFSKVTSCTIGKTFNRRAGLSAFAQKACILFVLKRGVSPSGAASLTYTCVDSRVRLCLSLGDVRSGGVA